MEETNSITSTSTDGKPPVSGSAFTCYWCGKHSEGKPIIGGDMKEKEFCSWSCQKNDWEHYHDNWFSDADSGL